MKSEPNRDSKERGDRRSRRTQPGVDINVERVKIEEKDTVVTPVDAANIPRETSITPTVKSDEEETLAGDISLKLEPGKPPKIARTSSKKVTARPPPTYLDLEDATAEAKRSFDVLTDCNYANKTLGSVEPAWECDCHEEWDAETSTNLACGEDSDCINRVTRIECPDDCHCGQNCRNQRFARKEYADVSVIKTEKKGYGLRANVDLAADTLIFEYIGEVIGEGTFRKRLVQYDQEGIKHFYFMSLDKGQFIDATKKGNLGRFCNHSCNPNCYVDKWTVGEKVRMGIFTERYVEAGEELVFNYNVDRYGANPQPCYCGENNCTGFIGGKTQTERATKLSAATIEALGLEDGEDWDIAVANKKSNKKKKVGDVDEEYVESLQPKSLDEKAVTKVMATLMQTKEKWIAVKLLSRIQQCEDEKVWNRVVRMHGYQILNTALTKFIEDANVNLQVLDILHKLPRITRNKIQDSKIEPTVSQLLDSENEDVKSQASELIKIWSKLEMGYRIPRLKRDPNATVISERVERSDREDRRRPKSRSRSRSRSPDLPKGPSGRPLIRQGFPPPRPAFRRPPFVAPLPAGWFSAQANGKTYYYSANGQTTWTRPTQPTDVPPPPPKEKTNEQKLQDIINSITQGNDTPQDGTPSAGTPAQVTSEPATAKVKVDKKDKWKSYGEDKQMKIYENTLFPHIKYIMSKYKSRLPRDDLKRFAKEVSKKLVTSDFKNKRVTDPTTITPKQERNVKKYVKDYFDKAVQKKADHDAKKKKEAGGVEEVKAQKKADEDTAMSEGEGDAAMDLDDDDDDEPSPNNSTGGTKRKRDGEDTPLTPMDVDDDAQSAKKPREENVPPPPPPPPPPAQEEDEGMGEADMEMDDEEEVEAEYSGLHVVQEEGLSEQKGDGSESFTQEAREAVAKAEVFVR